jgi:hypothetical protein
VEHEAPPFCRACNDFHEESTCPNFHQINVVGTSSMNNYVGQSRHANQIKCMGFSRHSNYINNVGKTHPVSMDHWIHIKERSENADKVVEEYDNVTKMYGQNPTPEQILEITRYKGVTYQLKGNEDQFKSYLLSHKL